MSEEQKKEFLTGFAVLIGKDGGIFLEMDKNIFSVSVERDASLREVRRFMGEILSDIHAQTAAEYTLLKLASANKQGHTPAEAEE
jgi:hypothetical protein